MIACLQRRAFGLKAGGIALALVAGVVLGDVPDEATEAAPASPAQEAAPAVTELSLHKLRRTPWSEGPVTNVFAGTTWAPRAAPAPSPPPAPVAEAPPAAPVAPALPFVYVGQFQEEGQPTVYYLERGVQVLLVSAGQNVDASYRLEGLSNGALQFIFLPLNTRQSLRIGE